MGIEEIRSDDAVRVSQFLHTHLNPRVPVSAWAALVRPPWGARPGGNHGFQILNAEDQVVGAYVAVYSARESGARQVCNLAAFCVLPEQRLHAMRLVKRLLAQEGLLFTDLSPSGNVPAMNERLGFRHLDTATRLVPNLPSRARGARVSESPAVLSAALSGADAIVYEDHRRAPAARHLVVDAGGRTAYLMYRRDRRKRLPVFASPLHVGGDRAVLEDCWPSVASFLLSRGLPATLAERRVLGFVPGGPGRELARPRPKMYRAEPGAEPAVDYLYSEMTLLEW